METELVHTPPLNERGQQHAYATNYRGRVRTGCLTCRSRKVKCDELQPTCNNCIRVKRRCVYKARKIDHDHHRSSAHERPSPRSTSIDAGHVRHIPSPQSVEEQDYYPIISPHENNETPVETCTIAQNPFQYPDPLILDVTTRLRNAIRGYDDSEQQSHNVTKSSGSGDTTSPATLVSRDIELTTTMDILATQDVLSEPSFTFFLEEVDCPWVTPYDGSNWRRIKHVMVEMGKSDEVIASALVAVAVLYKAQLYGLPLSKATSIYHTAKAGFGKVLGGDDNSTDNEHQFERILVATFLLGLFEFINYEMVPSIKELAEPFMNKLQLWKQSTTAFQQRTEISTKIITWLKLLYVTTMRGGGLGIIPENIFREFPDNTRSAYLGTGALDRPPLGSNPEASVHLYDLLSAPIFDFYFQLQILSGEIARETHYHRSRTTGLDQEDVIQRITNIKSRLHSLWINRPSIQQQTPRDLRSCLAPKIAGPLIRLIGVCAAAYYAEIVEIDRVLGDPVSKCEDSREARHQIRMIIEGNDAEEDDADDWNAYHHKGRLNSGYLRPLFLYAIECMDRDENEWAVEKIGEIRNQICRSQFFAMFGKALSDAQLRKERRVTSKYFCIWYFGVAPPFM
ncbi:hypothetical protein ZTR_06902 [Talaromyces verruculosus]|nr:hypothetical protein ZTR_06902 [Talaromyces verruculosus]